MEKYEPIHILPIFLTPLPSSIHVLPFYKQLIVQVSLFAHYVQRSLDTCTKYATGKCYLAEQFYNFDSQPQHRPKIDCIAFLHQSTDR